MNPEVEMTWRPLTIAALVLFSPAWAQERRPAQQPPGPKTPPGPAAVATLRNAQGQPVGTALLIQYPAGVLLQARFEGLPPGPHAFHIHQTGACVPPFKSAGGHFAPAGDDHGIADARDMHAGDLPNIYVPERGALRVDYFLRQVTLAQGPAAVLDKDGSALIVHAQPDDYVTDPAGDAGDRIACGVLEPAGTRRPELR